MRAEGDATLSYGLSARLFVKAKAKQANVDALLRRKGEDGVPPARAVAVLTAALGPALAGMGGLTVEADVAAGDVILGSETMSDLSASVQRRAGSAARRHASTSGLPGGSRFKADGELETGSAPKFRGAIDFSTDDLSLCSATGRARARRTSPREPPRWATLSPSAAPRFRATSRPPPSGFRVGASDSRSIAPR